MLSFKDLLSAEQIQTQDIDELITLADSYKNKLDSGQRCTDLTGSIVASLFFEPSTRTRFSFETAMHRLGGNVITLEQGTISSSVKKGETLQDMGRVMSSYADIIVIRHPKPNSVAEFATFSKVPVINAGDGPNQHPTQSLVDIYTIYSEKKKLNGLTIGFVGDLKHGRTIHSLINLLQMYPQNKFIFISHPDLAVPATLKETHHFSIGAINE